MELALALVLLCIVNLVISVYQLARLREYSRRLNAVEVAARVVEPTANTMDISGLMDALKKVEG